MKVTKSDISLAIATTPSSLDHTNIRAMRSAFLGFYTPKDANLCVVVYATGEADTLENLIKQLKNQNHPIIQVCAVVHTLFFVYIDERRKIL
jgi:hypothetical protein